MSKRKHGQRRGVQAQINQLIRQIARASQQKSRAVKGRGRRKSP